MAQNTSLTTPFLQRAETAAHPLTAYLYRLMDAKSSNLCLSADVSTARELLLLADRVGPSIVVLKTHYDIVSGWDYNPQTGTGAQLASLARKHGFLLFEDRKYADIGKTVQQQYTAGTARVIEWAHLVTVNMDAGVAAVTALSDAAARWRERVYYEVKTSVTVGTPITEEDGSSGSGGSGGSHAGGRGTSPAAFDRLPWSLAHDKNELPTFAADAHATRKGSVVSITTAVTQHFEPVDSPRLPVSGFDDLGGSDSRRPSAGGFITNEVYSGLGEAPLERGILLLAQMSSEGNLMSPAYTQACVEAGRAHKQFVAGFIAQQNLNTAPDDNFVLLTPGCKLPTPEEERAADDAAGNKAIAGDGLGQQYNTPAKLVGVCGSDIVIVGRGIITAADPASEAERYRRRAWKAYLGRLPE